MRKIIGVLLVLLFFVMASIGCVEDDDDEPDDTDNNNEDLYRDYDGDGWSDSSERQYGTSPYDPHDYPGSESGDSDDDDKPEDDDDEPEPEPWYDDIVLDSSSTVTVEITIEKIDSSAASGTVDDIRTKLSLKNNGNEKTPTFSANLYTSFVGKTRGMRAIGYYQDIRISSGSSYSLLNLDFPVDDYFEWDSSSSNDYLYVSIGEKTDNGDGSYSVTRVNEFWVSCTVIEN